MGRHVAGLGVMTLDALMVLPSAASAPLSVASSETVEM